MAQIPPTSATLLNDLARDSQHARWGEFVARYRPMMEEFLRKAFPSVDADETVQETLVSLIRQMPVYRYVPEENAEVAGGRGDPIRVSPWRLPELREPER